MIRSMTGFGHAEGLVGQHQVSVEVRTVNHRFFSPSIRLPASMNRWEAEVRETLRTRVARGHVTLGARIERNSASGASIDHRRFAEAVEELRTLLQRHHMHAEVDLASVLRMPDVIATAQEDEATGTVEELMAIVNQALDVLMTARREEGARLAVVIEERLALVESAVERIARRAPERLVAHRDRLRNAVRELADGIAIDEQRLAQEIAILADRLDIAEETDRFRSHIIAFRSVLREGAGEPAGKRLGFLLQEMLREANTTGSKGADSASLHEVVGVKEELERIREQVENLE